MKKELNYNSFGGTINAIPSKSDAHRLLICAALSCNASRIECPQTSKDIDASVSCLNALGAEISYCDGGYSVAPIKNIPENAILPCGESGSTLRFLLPIVCGLGVPAVFILDGRLSQRPLSPLKEELESHGSTIIQDGNRLYVGGALQGNDFTIAGNISSQFISGLLFMLAQRGGTLTVTGQVESSGYIDMTLRSLSSFGAKIEYSKNIYTVKKCELCSPDKITVEGDWSNAAFFLAAACLGRGELRLDGLDISSTQGDREIIRLLKSFGASIRVECNSVIVSHSALHAIDINAAQIPDLVPVLSVIAAAATGTSRIYNATRLRLKESDRLETTAAMINSLGGNVKIINDELFIHGTGRLSGGTVFSANDHRIAMSAAVASLICDNVVLVEDAQAVEKSYPAFWKDFEALAKPNTIK